MIESNILKKVIDKVGTPLFIYDEKVIIENISRIIKTAEKYGLKERIKLFVPYFTNSNPHISKIIKSCDVGILVQTEEEYYQLAKFGLVDDEIMVSPTYLSDNQIDFWISKNIPINLASIEEVEYLVKKYLSKPINFRIDGSFWQNQRTGIKKSDFQRLNIFLKNNKVIPNSFHIYCGTGSNLQHHKKYLVRVFNFFKRYFSELKQINLGGGFRFDYNEKLNSGHFDWDGYFSFLQSLIKKFNIPNDVVFVIEPGRDVLADSGDFIIQINRVIERGGKKTISTDGSYTYLPSAKMKKRQHKYEFLTKNFNTPISKKTFSSFINGSATLSSDYVLPKKVNFPEDINIGDYIIIHDVGAYGSTEKLEFLNKKPCAEVLIKDGECNIINNRGSELDKIRNVPQIPQII